MFRRFSSLIFPALALCLFPGTPSRADEVNFDQAADHFRQTLKLLVEADTTNPPGNEARAVKIVARRLKDAGIPYEITEFAPGRQDIVARIKGSGQKRPLLLLAHLDVVGTKDQVWSVPQHQLTEKDGYLYGRGSLDDLSMAAANVETLIQLKKSGVRLERDVIVALTGDEESGGLGIRYLLKQDPTLAQAEFALNEGGMPFLQDGKVRYIALNVAEKTYQDFTLKTQGESGHSSIPKKDNAIHRLARALDRLARYPGEDRLIPATRAYFKARAQIEDPQMRNAMLTLANFRGAGPLPRSALRLVQTRPIDAALLRTTCIPTLISGGTRENALPVEATANINCRILPDETVEQVQSRLRKIVADPKVEISEKIPFTSAPASEMNGAVPETLRTIAHELWPDAIVIPYVQTGGTDSRFLRARGVQAYGLSPFAITEGDLTRAHGVDERIPVASVRPGLEYFYRIVMKLAASP